MGCRGLLIACLLLVSSTGCRAIVHEINQHGDQLAAWWNSRLAKPPELTDQTWELLRFWELDSRYVENPQVTLQLAAANFAERPTAEWAAALAELTYLAGERAERQRQLPAAGASYFKTLCYSYYFLFERNQPLDPFDRRNGAMIGFYNDALEKCLLLADAQQGLTTDGHLRLPTPHGMLQARISRHGYVWHERSFSQLLFARDFTPRDHITHQHEYGLGVAMIGIQQPESESDPNLPQFLRQGHPFAVTAFLHPDLSLITPHTFQTPVVRGETTAAGVPPQPLDAHLVGTLELYDPLRHSQLEVAGRTVPLEVDLAAPMSYVLKGTEKGRLELGGFLEPDTVQQYTGLHMFEPYQPGKIPVVFVHGLLSGPVTWSEMFRALWEDPEIRENYQFWFFLYPTGTPFVASAAKLRAELQQVVDRYGEQDSALHHMVLVGHSMGGLVSKLQVTESRDQLWSLVSPRPLEELKTGDETRQILQSAFFFEPQNAVERVVFIATPHKGSDVSLAPIGRLGSLLIQAPQQLKKMHRQLVRDNPEIVGSSMSLGVPTSVDLLASDSPVLQAMYALPYDPQVKLHSIVGTSSQERNHGRSAIVKFLMGTKPQPGDGVVPLTSAELPIADSEVEIPATHGRVHRHPLAFREVRRILREHLAQVERASPIRQLRNLESEAIERADEAADQTGAPPVPLRAAPRPTGWQPTGAQR